MDLLNPKQHFPYKKGLIKCTFVVLSSTQVHNYMEMLCLAARLLRIIKRPHTARPLVALKSKKTIFLILYEMGMDNRSATKNTLVPRSGFKKAVRCIMGITPKAIRILASRWCSSASRRSCKELPQRLEA